MFETRSLKLERIDTGDYTPAEYERFLREIKFINRWTGDEKALKNTLFREIEKSKLQNFRLLDVGAGSGELLRATANFAGRKKVRAALYGLELNEVSARAILRESKNFAEIKSVRGDALQLPFADNSFDFVISSLFTHHLKDRQIIEALREMKRVALQKIFVIDLHRHPLAYLSYKAFCRVFRISRLVTEDGSLSILRSFTTEELSDFAGQAGLRNAVVERHFPFRLVLRES